MKTPCEVKNEVKEKYFPIAEKRAKEFLNELDSKIEQNKEEYYLYNQIPLGDHFPFDIKEKELPQEYRNSEKVKIIYGVIDYIVRTYIDTELKERGWKMVRHNGEYYLEGLGEH